MSGNLGAVCFCVMGPQNNPVYMKSFPTNSDEETIKFMYICWCSLDVIEEKVETPKRTPNDLQDQYLGLLHPTQDYFVYGYQSNTKVKMVLVTERIEKDSEVKKMMQLLYQAYADCSSNPWYTPGQPIASASFDRKVSAILKAAPPPASHLQQQAQQIGA